jgi:negative regulator of sigma-B (phosphoserine phosphatase)
MEAMTVVAWATCEKPLDTHAPNGDRAVVAEFSGGALVALIDGLGHGHDAHVAATTAERVLVDSPEEPIGELLLRCHEALRKTRGAVMTLASFNARHGTMTWLGVGNVEGWLVRENASAEAVPMRGGTIGFMLPAVTPRTLPVHAGDTLVLASDGIKHGFREEVRATRAPQQIADEVMTRWAKTSDDACVLVARYQGVS